MMNGLIRRFLLLAVTAIAAHAQNTVEKVLVGETKVTLLDSYKGISPLPKPAQAVLIDFKVPNNVITLDHSPAAHVLAHDPIAKMKHDEGHDESPAAVAKNVQAAFAKTFISELQKMSLPAAAGTDNDLPVNAIVVRGDFTNVNLGNKTARMMIGFGRGASDVKAHVIVSLNTGSESILVSEFNITSASGKKPGAAATMGVGSAVASVGVAAAADGKATVEGDASRMAKAVSKQIQAIMVAQHWSEPKEDSK